MMHTFGENLRELREERDLKQKEVADALFISNKMLSSYERGISQPPIDMLIRICEFFQVSADSLLGIEEHPEESAGKHGNEGTGEESALPDVISVPKGTGRGYSSSADDRRILSYYHRLDPESKDAIRGLMICYCKEQEQKEAVRESEA